MKFEATLTLMMLVLDTGLRCDAGTPCDPSSSAPLVSFSVRQDIAHARTEYTVFPNTCTFDLDQTSRMEFKAQDTTFKYYKEVGNGITFTCVQKQRDSTYKLLVPNMRLLSSLFAGTTVRFENCHYAPQSSAVKTVVADDTLYLKSNERRLIAEALSKSNGDTEVAAKNLGISQSALRRKIKEYNIK